MAEALTRQGVPRVVALDLDGVVYHGPRAIPGAAEAVAAVRAAGSRVFFCTNNSGSTRAQIAAKLEGLGVPAAPEDVLGSAYAAAALVTRLAGGPADVFAVGGAGLGVELQARGHRLVSAADRPAYAVVGMGSEVGYRQMAEAFTAVTGGAVFVACNRDRSYPADGGRWLPGCAAIVGGIEASLGRPADHLAGKPSPLMLSLVAEATGARPDQMLVVGDGVDSDLAMADAWGAPWALIAPDGPTPDTPFGPHFRSLAELAAAWFGPIRVRV